MNPTDPQLLYMMLVLPSLFGLTLIGEGIIKIFSKEFKGWISIILGIIFIVLTILVYLFFSLNLI